jgi:hypothetical protein
MDALEIALCTEISTIVIASADGGFAQVAQRLRRYGKAVVGASESEQSAFFAASCVAHLHLVVKLSELEVKRLHVKIAAVLGNQPEGRMPLGEFGKKMMEQQVAKSDLPEARWSSFLAKYPDLYGRDNQCVYLIDQTPQSMVHAAQ